MPCRPAYIPITGSEIHGAATTVATRRSVGRTTLGGTWKRLTVLIVKTTQRGDPATSPRCHSTLDMTTARRRHPARQSVVAWRSAARLEILDCKCFRVRPSPSRRTSASSLQAHALPPAVRMARFSPLSVRLPAAVRSGAWRPLLARVLVPCALASPFPKPQEAQGGPF